MSKQFLDFYLKNLNYIKSSAAEFAKEFPKIASKLDISQFESEDPFIERLLEGTAFLAARVDEKISSGFPRMLESLLYSLSSKSLFPIPSYAIVELIPNYSNMTHDVSYIDKEEIFKFDSSLQGESCRYTPVWESPIYPFNIVDSIYTDRDIENLGISEELSAILILKLEMIAPLYFSDLKLLNIDFFLNMNEVDASTLISHLFSNIVEIYVKNSDTGEIIKKESCKFSLTALESGIRNFNSYTNEISGLLGFEEYFSYIDLFKFCRLTDKDQLFLDMQSKNVELIFGFNKKNNDLKNIISKDAIKLNYIPLINIFKMRSSRMIVEQQVEYHIVPDVTNALNYEVYDIERVDFYNASNEKIFSAKPFYHVDNDLLPGQKYDYFSLYRKDKQIGLNSYRSNYLGQEVFISIAGENWHNNYENIQQLSAELLCTNRDLPIFLKEGIKANVQNNQIQAASLVYTPSKPKKSLISNKEENWEKLLYVMLNLSSILWRNGDIPLHIIRNIIQCYSALSLDETERIANAIVAIKTKLKNFRFVCNHSVFYEQGWQIDVEFSEQKVQDVGYFLFACVLWNFFKQFSPLNSHIEMNLYTQEQGFIVRWTTLEN
ncbi:type VI secretion system baseplate subunit TssF [Helicobacter canadensis]|uniref:Type VI secretion protein n=1 Tax=Helicobacter canadensis MIT 98-5491 TaxID=537970 RepID=C5ZYU3_9HELI|nr:type VI secretion system baseplate subunit TssF [Helicobacter canadensis]EES89201.1 conserved hypothetical protein [Helicobacter canadensis MIT 98-5491]EFR47985.1 type VI secretion protein, VC_A0110 family [Helicobacter canadensis MIT 98-5491]STO99235.1 VC_A0110 family type VI secretion protein [Helicobacter canadensis]